MGIAKKWTSGKTREKLNNAVLFSRETFEKMMKDVPKSKLITVSMISEKYKVSGSLARRALRDMARRKLIKCVQGTGSTLLYTKIPEPTPEPTEEAAAEGEEAAADDAEE